MKPILKCLHCGARLSKKNEYMNAITRVVWRLCLKCNKVTNIKEASLNEYHRTFGWYPDVPVYKRGNQ